MQFATFAQYLEKLEQTPSRLDMTHQLAELYRQLDPEEVDKATYLMEGRLVPEYESLEFNLSTKMIQRALARLLERHQSDASQPTTQTNLFGEEQSDFFIEQVNARFKKIGDVGSVAEAIRASITAPDENVSLLEIYRRLATIAELAGKGSQDEKVAGLVSLLEAVTPLSARYIARIIMGKVRLGFSTMTLLDALSWATQGDKSQRLLLEEAYDKQADVGKLAQTYLAAGNDEQRQQALDHYTVQNGVPVIPALAQRLDTAQDVVEKMNSVYVEPKYDGLRVQVHYHRGKPTKVYTRNLEDMSHMVPELEQLEKSMHADSAILDGEAIGYDPQTDSLVAFQQTITRKRKHQVTEQAAAVPFRFFFFDVLEVDGKPLVDQPLSERKQRLATLFDDNQTFRKTYYEQIDDPKKIRQFHKAQLVAGLEGIIAKQVDSQYRGGRKGWRWVKMKEEEGSRGKLSDTIDCIVMGYYVGKGKRSAFGIGAILVGIIDAETDMVKTVTKIGTGLTDEQFREMKQRVDQVATDKKPVNYEVPKELTPDVWANPQVVIEVAADEITDSPMHTAGVALRFPRLVSFRDDKDWEAATTVAEVIQIQSFVQH